MSATGAIISGIAGLTAAGVNAAASAGATRQARKENYHYNELAAQNADQRTRALYSDLYSPGAQLQQLKDAGLSPSLMYQDGGGISGQSGAQGAGTAGPVQNPFFLDPLTMAQTANLMADTKKKEAEAKKTGIESENEEINKQINELKAGKMEKEFTIMNMHVEKNGKDISVYEYAGDFYSFDKFLKAVREQGKYDSSIENAVNSDFGRKTLQGIYISRNEFARNIAVLSQEETDAQFRQSIVNALKDNNFEELNAEEAITKLQAQIETNKLTEQQNEAWNDLLNKLKNADDAGSKILIVLAMIADRALSSYKY